MTPKKAELAAELALLQQPARSTVLEDITNRAARNSAGNGSGGIEEDALFSHLMAQSVLLSTETQVVLGRLAGVTTFIPSNPNPVADGKAPKLLGFRYEVFANGTFQTPYYVIVSDATSEEGQLQVYKHTLPTFINVNEIAERTLHQEPEIFIREIRAELARFAHRKSVVDLLSGLQADRLEADDACQHIVLETKQLKFHISWLECGATPEKILCYEKGSMQRKIQQEQELLNSESLESLHLKLQAVIR